MLSLCLVILIALFSSSLAAQEGTQSDEGPGLTNVELRELSELTRRMSTEIRDIERSNRSSRPQTIEGALRAVGQPRSPANIFRWVRDNIDFEPYVGALRGPSGTLVAGSGNAVDQALLLQALYEAAGHRTRFVLGTLHAGDSIDLLQKFAGSAALLQSTTPERGGLFDGADAAVQARYLGLLNDHLWIEVDDGGVMRPADPIGAPLFGMSPAVARERSETLPEIFHTSLEIQLVGHLDDGQEIKHLTVSGPLSRYAYRALTLGFSDDPSRRGARRPSLTLDGRSTHGQPIPVGNLEHLELRYTLTIGRRENRWAQTLYRRGSGADIFAFDQQHFSIAVIPGWTSNDQVVGTGAAGAKAAIAKIDQWIDARRQASRAASPIEIRQTVQAVLDDLAPLLAFAFVRNLDRITFEMADTLGVRPILQSPRIVTTGIMRQADRFYIDLELKGDVIEAMPMGGVPAVSATGFLGLYGRIKNELAGDLLEETTERRTTTVNTVFRGAQRERIPFATITSDSLDILDKIDVEPYLKQNIRELTTRKGMIVLLPTRTVAIEGAPHYGWWALHPATGAIEGYTHDALLSQRASAVTIKPAHEVLDTMRGTLSISARLYRSIQRATEDTGRYGPAVCAARNDLVTLSRATCATKAPLALPSLSSCLEGPKAPGHDLLSFTLPSCATQIEQTQCGAVVIDALLKGRLAVVNPQEILDIQAKAAAAEESVRLPREPVCR